MNNFHSGHTKYCTVKICAFLCTVFSNIKGSVKPLSSVGTEQQNDSKTETSIRSHLAKEIWWKEMYFMYNYEIKPFEALKISHQPLWDVLAQN